MQGYTGNWRFCSYNECQEQVDLCGVNAVCVDQSVGYRCHCTRGWEGDNCENPSPTPSPTPLPAQSPTASPTNSPTWPAHVFVPVLALHTPWYFDFTPPPYVETVEFVTAPTPANVYVPANHGAMSLPYCLGFGDECVPVYGDY